MQVRGYGLSAPKKTPAEIIERLNLEVGAELSDPKLKERLENGSKRSRPKPGGAAIMMARHVELHGDPRGGASFGLWS